MDVCLRWSRPIEGAADLLRVHEIAIVDELPALSIFFRGLDSNLLELMASDESALDKCDCLRNSPRGN